MFGYEEWRKPSLTECTGLLRRFQNLATSGVGILPMGEEEVKVAKSEAPVTTGVWCNRE